MMDCFSMMGGHGPMIWVMGSFALLVLVVLLLGVAALTKYLLTRAGHGRSS